MSAANKALLRYTIDKIFNQRRIGFIASAYAPECWGDSPDGPMQGRNAFGSFFEKYATAFPDFSIDIESVIAEGDLVVATYIFTGTNTGPLAGIPPTGHVVTVPSVVTTRIKNHWILEQSFIWDNLKPRRRVWQAIAAERQMGVGNSATIHATPQP